MEKTVELNCLPLTQSKQEALNWLAREYFAAFEKILSAYEKGASRKELHEKTYSSIKSTSQLPSQLVIQARIEAWNRRKQNKPRKLPISFDERVMRSFETSKGTLCFAVTIKPGNRIVLPIAKDGAFQRFKSFVEDGWLFKSILLKGNKRNKILVVLKKEFPKPSPSNDKRFVVGVDVGATNFAAVTVFDSLENKVVKQLYFGRDVAARQRKFVERRAKLQALADKGSFRAEKALAKLRFKQRNFVKNRSGEVAKQIAALAKKYGAVIAVEKLKLKAKAFGRKSNGVINRIPYGLLKKFLSSNAEVLGIQVQEIDAYHTSKWCPRCGAVSKSGHSSNNYSLFKCKCGFECNRDRKASLAIAFKSLLERRIHSLKPTIGSQFSSRRAPVNGLLRLNEVGLSNVAVQQPNQLTESLRTCP